MKKFRALADASQVDAKLKLSIKLVCFSSKYQLEYQLGGLRLFRLELQLRVRR
jgi:hypothetical protein